ncbi:MAG: permease, partial [Candidatus Omnitrophica bacterium]|nr:permease [Candidatus Omnitrophota bacterium]
MSVFISLLGGGLSANLFYLLSKRISATRLPPPLPFPPRWLKFLTAGLLIYSWLSLFWCLRCSLSPEVLPTFASYPGKSFFQSLGGYFGELFPVVMVSLSLVTLIEKTAGKHLCFFPRNTLTTAVWAIILPVCSCAAIPLAASLRKNLPARAILTFLFLSPLLSPFVIIFGTAVLGWQYTFWRVISALFLGLTGGFLLKNTLRSQHNIQLTSLPNDSGQSQLPKDFLLTTWENLVKTWPPLLSGIFLGVAATRYLPLPFFQQTFPPNFTGLVMATALGIPIFLCGGQEIPLLKPFFQFGLPMGQAIAFTLAGNGICLTSIPLLAAFFGKKMTFWFV